MSTPNKLARKLFYRVRSVRVRDCVHYCGFRYGVRDLNPYEIYFRETGSGTPTEKARANFLDFVRHFRPRDLGEALSLDVEGTYPPLWQFPWRRYCWRSPQAWCENAADIPDILTHFSEEGIPELRIRDEYAWLEGAWHSITANGYRPSEHSHVRVFELVSEERSAYIVADGNHRLAALSVQGIETLEVILAPIRTARRARSKEWPAVRAGRISEKDALRIFDAYFHGNQTPHRAASPAPLVTAAPFSRTARSLGSK